jgi:hypothetical protein
MHYEDFNKSVNQSHLKKKLLIFTFQETTKRKVLNTLSAFLVQLLPEQFCVSYFAAFVAIKESTFQTI